jgi:hypothetical protein
MLVGYNFFVKISDSFREIFYADGMKMGICSEENLTDFLPEKRSQFVLAQMGTAAYYLEAVVNN